MQADGFEVLAYCLMGNHIHILARTGKTDISSMELAMKRLGIRYAGYYNRRYQRVGPVFQGRYKSVPVSGSRYFLRVLRYIHRNPVKAGLASSMDAYPWSSYADYFGSRETTLCEVHTEYAALLCELGWLHAWHEQDEPNPAAFSGSPVRLPDAAVCALSRSIAGCAPQDLHRLPADRLAVALRRLVLEEGAHIPQLSRLSGVPRGVIRRHTL